MQLYEFAKNHFESNVTGQKSDQIVLQYEMNLKLGRLDAAERIADKYPWVRHEDSELPPYIFAELWEWFLELSVTRPRGLGIGAISHTEIKSFTELRDIELFPDQVKLIRSLDNLFLQAESKRKTE